MPSKISAIVLVMLLVLPILLPSVQSVSAEVDVPVIPVIMPTPIGSQATQVSIDHHGAGTKISLHGYFYYIQSTEPWVPLPIRGAEIEVYDDDGLLGCQKMDSGYTDDNGYFSFSGLENPIDLFEWSDPDIYVEVHASNWVTDVHDNPWWWGGSVFRFRTGVVQDCDSGDLIDLGQWVCPTEQYRVWDIFETFQAGYWFMVDETGNTPPKIRSFYDDILQGNTAYYQGIGMGDEHGILSLIPSFIRDLYSNAALLSSANGIHFSPAYSDHTTVLHEYGHYIMDLYMDLDPPDTVSPHNYTSSYTDQHGLVEGWGYFFSAVVRHWWGAPVEDYRDNYPVERNYEGSGCEAAVAGILWDLYDSPEIVGGVDDDDLSLGFAPVWNILVGYDPNEGITGDWPLGADHPWTIYDFWDGWRFTRAGPELGEVVEILYNHGIDLGDSEPPTNPTGFTSTPDVDTPSLLDKVTVTWSGAYDVYDGNNVNVKEYIFYFGSRGLANLPYPSILTKEWYYNVTKDVGGTGTFTSRALSTGVYYLYVRAVDNAGNLADDVFRMGPFYASEGLLVTTALVSSNIPFNPTLLMNPDTSVTLEVTAADPTPTTHYEIIDSSGVSGGVIEYFESFRFADHDLVDGEYTLRYFSEDDSGNVEPANIRTIVLDSTPPSTSISISEPKVVVYSGKLGTITHVNSSTTVTLNPSDSGTGVKETKYRINNEIHDLGWQIYEGPIQLTDISDGGYWLEYFSTDNVGNVEPSKREIIVLDNVGPSMRIQIEEGPEPLDGITVTTSAFDLKPGMGTLSYTISRVSRFAITPVEGFIDLSATSLPNNIFSLQIDLSSISNGEYLITAMGKDKLGNVAETSCSYSRTQASIDAMTLLPFTTICKAGRTAPIKFSLRTNSLIDPDQPFVYDEGLTIDIRVNGASTPSQVSTFGITSKDYRVDSVAEIYIVNFKTANVPTIYSVTIYRGTTILGSFDFSTTK